MSTSTLKQLDLCPMCEKPAVNPERLEGQLWCGHHVERCTVCSRATLPGEAACIDCQKMIGLQASTAAPGELRIAS